MVFILTNQLTLIIMNIQKLLVATLFLAVASCGSKSKTKKLEKETKEVAYSEKKEEVKLKRERVVTVSEEETTEDLGEGSTIELNTGFSNGNSLNYSFESKVVDAYLANRTHYINNEEYSELAENEFTNPREKALSTFSIDVDNASYTNVRRMLEDGQLPNPNAVRVEEFINYFDYTYAVPKDKSKPFNIETEIAECPWNKEHKLLHVGLQGYTVKTEDLPSSNLVFLVDVSGSMNDPSKIGLLKKSFKMMVDKLDFNDKVAIVTYAGNTGVVLNSTSCLFKSKIYNALDNLFVGGGTNGEAGIELAYKIAEQNYISKGNNRIILATDGDFNVGQSSDEDMKKLMEEKRDKGIYMTVLGYGMGNYKDGTMETIADNGNGNYFYIDSKLEANNVLVHNLAGTLLTIAKDVKIQVEFNPNKVKEYRLIGYENRVMDAQDFDNDKKDAGEMGAGHNVTAIYEIIPGKSKQSELKYQKSELNYNGEEMCTIKFRYKLPKESKSKMLSIAVIDRNKSIDLASSNFQFASAVAEFGLILRKSEYKVAANYNSIIIRAKKNIGSDDLGKRMEFVGLVRKAQSFDETTREITKLGL